MQVVIVHELAPVTLVGGAEVAPEQLNMALRRAPTLVAADGGADALLAAGLVPQAVIGDMDSLSDAAHAAFEGLLHEIADQNTADFEKCLTAIDAPVILALGFLGGRLDHTMAVLNVLVRHAARPVVLIGPDELCFLAPQGEVQLSLPMGARVALLPMDHVQVKTQGLRWDIDARYHPAGAISTSNEAAAAQVTIRCDGPLLITLPPEALEAALAVVTGPVRAR